MNKRGFTLIELLVVIAIIGILAMIAIPGYIGQQKSAARNEAYTNLQNLRLLEEQYYAERGKYSPCAAPAYTSPVPPATVTLGTPGKDHPTNAYDSTDPNGLGVIAKGDTGAGSDPNNALSGFKPGDGLSFSYWIVNGQRFPINTGVNPPTATNINAGDPPCFVAFAAGNSTSRTNGDVFAIDCNNTRNF